MPQVDTIELNLRFNKIFLFSAVDPLSKFYYVRAYHHTTSFSARNFLRRLVYLHLDNIRYLQVDNGTEWEKHFIAETKKRKITFYIADVLDANTFLYHKSNMI